MRQLVMNLLVKRTSNLLFHETKRFAGHSKWANIKHDKAVIDQKRADLFRKLASRMKVVIKESGGITDPSENLPLAKLIDQAKKANMPVATIKRAIETKEPESNKFVLTAQFSSNVLMIVHMDYASIPIAKQNVQVAIRKLNAKLVAEQPVLSHFEVTHTIIAQRDCTLDQAIEDAIKVDAEHVDEVEKDDAKYFEFTCDPAYASKCENKLLQMDYDVLFSELTYYPRRPIDASQVDMELLEKLRKKVMDVPGVKRIEDNIELSE